MIKEQDKPDTPKSSVFSSVRDIEMPRIELPSAYRFNERIKSEGLVFLRGLPECISPVAFLDPQYRGVLDHLSYGNEEKHPGFRGGKRASLMQMTDSVIADFVKGIERILVPSGHLFLWMDKYHLCTGFLDWLTGTSLEVVDLVTWHKGRMGMGYRTRRVSEYLVILQKKPRRAKGVWTIHNIPDVWKEKVVKSHGVHPKPIGLQGKLIEAVSNKGDIVIDPSAGSFSVLEACRIKERNFLGCDING